MVKHKLLPMNAMMLSNAGKRTEIATNSTGKSTRIASLRMPRAEDERPVRAWTSATVWLRPNHNSISPTIGRALSGSLVRGTMAMKPQRAIERPRGYPVWLRILAVISSITLSPNIRSPITAVKQSRTYCWYVSNSYSKTGGFAHSKCEGCSHGLAISMGMSHVTIYIGKDTMSPPRAHK